MTDTTTEPENKTARIMTIDADEMILNPTRAERGLRMTDGAFETFLPGDEKYGTPRAELTMEFPRDFGPPHDAAVLIELYKRAYTLDRRIQARQFTCTWGDPDGFAVKHRLEQLFGACTSLGEIEDLCQLLNQHREDMGPNAPRLWFGVKRFNTLVVKGRNHWGEAITEVRLTWDGRQSSVRFARRRRVPLNAKFTYSVTTYK